MLAKVGSGAVLGMEAYPVEVEVDISSGLPAFHIVGLPDTAIKESKERVRAAILNSEFEFPLRRVTVNLAPADIKKEGPAFDLPVAVGILTATQELNPTKLDRYFLVGELSLTGEVRPINGGLNLAFLTKKFKKKGLILPSANALEAALVRGLEVIPVQNLREAVSFLKDEQKITPVRRNLGKIFEEDGNGEVDLAEVKGQSHAKRALEVAAAGGHNVLLIGPPGSGKTMLARRFPTILPNLTLEEALEITKIYSVAGELFSPASLVTKRPFRFPHHSISSAALVGGGQFPKPGEVSLSHQGVLFLDEFAEFPKDALQALRQPLEEGFLTISRVKSALRFPAEILLIAAMNPCPCGFFGDRLKECTCTPSELRKYRRKITGPLWDRIDLHIEVGRISWEELTASNHTEPSKVIKERVEIARAIQRKRFAGTKISTNSQMTSRYLKEYSKLNSPASSFLEKAVDQLGLSARAHDRILKVSRTIADLAKKETIELAEVAEAVQYRSLDRGNFVLR